jgi:excisionase family DNA binding protein
MTSAVGRQYFSLEEVAKKLRIDEGVLEALLLDGRLPALQLGGNWSIPEDALQQFLDEELRRQTQERRGAAAGAEEAPSQTEVSVSGTTGRISPSRFQGIDFTLKGKRLRARSFINLLAEVLTELAAADETFLRRFSAEGGRSRKYIARDRVLLYTGRPDLAAEFARPLIDGWWLGTNYSAKAILRILRKACEVAGLRFGIDLRVGHEPKKLDVAKAMGFVGIASDPDPWASVRHAELFAESIERARK